MTAEVQKMQTISAAIFTKLQLAALPDLVSSRTWSNSKLLPHGKPPVNLWSFCCLCSFRNYCCTSIHVSNKRFMSKFFSSHEIFSKTFLLNFVNYVQLASVQFAMAWLWIKRILVFIFLPFPCRVVFLSPFTELNKRLRCSLDCNLYIRYIRLIFFGSGNIYCY